jgi:hypothetical protein
MSSFIRIPVQNPLIITVDESEKILKNNSNAVWFDILNDFNYLDYVEIAVLYYDALYDYNKYHNSVGNHEGDQNETIEEARERLLKSRPTFDKSKPVLFEPNFLIPKEKVTSPYIAPGIVPHKCAGRKPKCFFALFKSFIGVSLMGFPSTPDMVFQNLVSNPAFARVCGFNPNISNDYHLDAIPSLRKIEQFDLIMERYGIWSQAKYCEISDNIKNEVIKIEDKVVGDTTHYHAYAQFEVVKSKDENGKEIKKSQSKVTKNCRCENQEDCEHEYVLTDDGAGTIVKSGPKMYFGHKASVIGFPDQGVALDAIALSDGATHDGQTFFPHVKDLFDKLPIIQPHIKSALYDSACCHDQLKADFKEEFNIDLKASLNPRGAKTIEDNLPKGMGKLTPYGNLVCNQGHDMDYLGVRTKTESYIYGPPKSDDGSIICKLCENKDECCSIDNTCGRTVNISYHLLPHIDETDPPMSKRFKAIMTKRPSVERMIKRLKCDLGDDRLKKRGNPAFQAYLDKTLIAYHILLRH